LLLQYVRDFVSHDRQIISALACTQNDLRPRGERLRVQPSRKHGGVWTGVDLHAREIRAKRALQFGAGQRWDRRGTA
jgi:hypothetical protein